jgi:fungalysin metallopeptidase (M36)
MRSAAERDGVGHADGMTWLRHETHVTSTRKTIVHLQQYFRGLRVYRSARVVSYQKRGDRSGPKRVAPGRRALVPLTLSLRPVLSAPAAAEAATAFLQRRGVIRRSLRLRVARTQAFVIPGTPTVLDCRRGFAEPIRAHLEVFPETTGKSRLAWVLQIAPQGGSRCEVVVSADAARPKVLFSTQTAACLNFQASWILFPADASAAGQFPVPALSFPLGAASPPIGLWLQQSGLADGPNASCHRGTSKPANALGQLEFDNTFVWCNFLHDFFAAYGFDSSLGAFDSGQDPLIVQVFLQSKSDRGGQFDNQMDGVSPVMKLFDSVFAHGTHAALDPSVIVHEYTHGVTNRLLGGDTQPSPFHGTEGQGLNEGYSDYFALTILSFLDRSAIGSGAGRTLLQIGPTFRPGGVRNYAGFTRSFSANVTEVYDLAMIWCGALLDARAQVATLPGVGPDAADRFLWQTLLDSLKSMSSACPQANCLTLAHAKQALLAESRAIELLQSSSFRGATAAIDGAMDNRGIV